MQIRADDRPCDHKPRPFHGLSANWTMSPRHPLTLVSNQAAFIREPKSPHTPHRI